MKRDMDLIRDILLRIESSNIPETEVARSPFNGYDDSLVTYHMGLLYDAELITAIEAHTTGGNNYIPTGLTWSGHEFLDASRNNDVWTKAKDYIASKGGGMTFDILKQLLTKYLLEQML